MKKNLISKLLLVAVVALSALSVTSCKNEDVDTGMPTLELSTDALLFDNSGAAADEFGGVIEVTANRSWTVEVDEAASEWLTVEPLSGEGDAELHVSVPATEVGRAGSAKISIFNAYGVLIEKRFTVEQGEVVQGDVVFDGSELPTTYGNDQAINVDGVDFTVNMVANFMIAYPDSQGPIQFGKSTAYLYNNSSFEGLKEVRITLAPAGTQYNNFKVYAGTSMNPTSGEIAPSKEGDVCTYVIPEGSTFVRIDNTAAFTAYASNITFSTTSNGGGTVTPNPEPDPDPDPKPDPTGEVIFDGSELPTAYADNVALTVGGINFTANQVANFMVAYPDSQGPIQFGKTSSFLCNVDAIAGLKEVRITLAPAGTQYNNFKVFAGTASNPTEGEIVVAKEGDVCTYAIPAGSEFVRIENTSNYTAYAFKIEFSTEEGGNEGGGTVTPNPNPEPDPDPDPKPDPVDGIAMDGSELPTVYTDNAAIVVDGINFTANQVANFMTNYPDSRGPIQFGKTTSYLCNVDAISGLKEVVIKLAPEGTQYNNFVVYAGTASNPAEGAITATKEGDYCTYAIPSGAEFIRIENTSDYTAYAFSIQFKN